MRRPLLWTLIWLLLLVLSGVIVWFVQIRTGPASGNVATAVLFLFTGLGFVALLFFIKAFLLSIGHAKLLAGRNVMARWRVTGEEWEQFRQFDSARASRDPVLTNDFRVAKDSRPEGVEIVVGGQQLMVDGSYHALRRWGLPELRGVRWLTAPSSLECIEFDVAYPKKYGTTRMSLRVPVSADARSDARRVLAHYESLIPPPREGIAYRNPWAVVGGGLIVAVLGLVVAGVGLAMRSLGSDAYTSALWMAIGLTACIAALIFTAIIAVVTQPWRKS